MILSLQINNAQDSIHKTIAFSIRMTRIEMLLAMLGLQGCILSEYYLTDVSGVCGKSGGSVLDTCLGTRLLGPDQASRYPSLVTS